MQLTAIACTCWTIEQEGLLLSLHEMYGNNWKALSEHFPGRNANQLKCKFNHTFNKPSDAAE
jgi:hypothetical protein